MSNLSAKSKVLDSIYNLNKYENKSSDYFHRKKRHVFILTDSGRPVYSRYGEESDLGPIIATFNVILHKMNSLNGEDTKDTIQKIENPYTKTIIVRRNELYTIVITKNKSDPDILIKKMIDALLHQILCSLTDNYIRQLKESQNYNPGNTLSAHFQTLAWSISASRHSFSSLLDSYMPFPLAKNTRDQCKQSMELYQEDGIFFKMLMTRHNIIAIDNAVFDLQPQDINSLFALVNSKFNIQGVDYIMPFCIPSISSNGYITVYFRYITPQIGVLILFEKVEQVPLCVQMCHKIEITLEDDEILKKLTTYANLLPITPDRLVDNCKFQNVVIYNLQLKQYSVFDSLAYSSSQNQHLRNEKSRKQSMNVPSSNNEPDNITNIQSSEPGVDFDFTNDSQQDTEPSKSPEKQPPKPKENMIVHSHNHKCMKGFINKVSQMYSTYLSNTRHKTKNNMYGTFEYYEKVGDRYLAAMKDKEMIVFVEQEPWGSKVSVRNQIKEFIDVIRKDWWNWWIDWDFDPIEE